MDRLENMAGDQGRANRLKSGAQPFGDDQQVRRHAILVTGEAVAGTAHRTSLVKNQ